MSPEQSADKPQTKRELHEQALREIMDWRWERFMHGTAAEFQAKLDAEVEKRMGEYDEAAEDDR